MKKRFAITALALALTAGSAMTSFAAGFTGTGKGVKYQWGDGSYCTNNWVQYRNHWFYFGDDQLMRTGWIQSADGNDWYYCDPDMNDDLIGKMLTNTIIRSAGKNYILDKDGKMIKPGNRVTLTIGESGVVSM